MIFELLPMTAQDYDEVIALWQSIEGVGLSNADSREAITRYLNRNPGFSQVMWAKDEHDPAGKRVLAGAVLCGHDGRRGLLHHLAVSPQFRRMGLGRRLVQRCLEGLRADGIDKCHLFVFNSNSSGRDFWLQCGWSERPELVLMSANC